MANVRFNLRGGHTLGREFRTLATEDRITRPTLERGAEDFVRRILRPNWGFTDRTKRLRLSVNHFTQREGGNVTSLIITAGARNERGQEYGGFVERKRRTRDGRPGPPYWFGRAWRNAQKQVARDVQREAERRVAMIGRPT